MFEGHVLLVADCRLFGYIWMTTIDYPFFISFDACECIEIHYQRQFQFMYLLRKREKDGKEGGTIEILQ